MQNIHENAFENIISELAAIFPGGGGGLKPN